MLLLEWEIEGRCSVTFAVKILMPRKALRRSHAPGIIMYAVKNAFSAIEKMNTIGAAKCTAAAKTGATAAGRPGGSGRGEERESTMSKKVLIVDDEEDVRLFLRDFLSDRDFIVETAANGEEALGKFMQMLPDVTLLDIMMPGMDGLECLEQIKKKSPQSTVIMITALKDESRMVKAKKLGAHDYIVKPFSLNYLETELSKILD